MAALATALVVGTANSAQAAGPRAFAISSDGKLMATFYTDTPQVLDWVRLVQGLTCGETRLIGLDFRVQNGLLYGVGEKGCIYTIKFPPAAPDVVVTKVSQLSVPLYGKDFGVDFNPAADRLRVISDYGQNLRHNLADHVTIEDTILTTPPAGGPTRGVTAAAYTNNDLNPDTATTLFDIGTLTDQVLVQAPANNGFLSPTGALGVDTGPVAGFDIYSDLTNGKTTSVSAFAVLNPASGPSSFYSVNLLTGAAAKVGDFPLPIADVAVALDTN
ncbi:lipoprotein [Amycolatopsis keratiniphila]|uniref:Lipoprotein n=1 Tax=Amycolatopsis keratiniphila TaxID=129921 RepID=R4T277_9PSEU|nr:lipoprotein [Amycolatopsis keratiniphila]